MTLGLSAANTLLPSDLESVTPFQQLAAACGNVPAAGGVAVPAHREVALGVHGDGCVLLSAGLERVDGELITQRGAARGEGRGRMSEMFVVVACQAITWSPVAFMAMAGVN